MPQLARVANAEKRPFRVATIAAGGLQPAYAWSYGLETADGYLNIYSERYKEFWERVDSPEFRRDPDLSRSFHGWGGRVYLFELTSGLSPRSEIRAADNYRLPLLSLANVKILISPVRLSDEGLAPLSVPTHAQLAWAGRKRLSRLAGVLKGEWQPVPLYLYENLSALPRYRFVNQSVMLHDATEVLTALEQAEMSDLQHLVYLVESDVRDVDLAAVAHGDSKIISEASNSDTITLLARTSSTQILIVANCYSPFWICQIDGHETRIFPVNYTFQGVVVPPGTHKVVLRYAPPYAFPFHQGRAR